jgi:hypothetical protein
MEESGRHLYGCGSKTFSSNKGPFKQIAVLLITEIIRHLRMFFMCFLEDIERELEEKHEIIFRRQESKKRGNEIVF